MAMKVKVFDTAQTMAAAAARLAAASLRQAIDRSGTARITVATGTSQFAFQDALTRLPEIAWPQVELFQLDEYIGLPPNHPASFKRLLVEHVIGRIPVGRVHFLEGDDPARICREAGQVLARKPLDLALIGIGENGHIAFNDPPADFDNSAPYAIVRLDAACRRQQVGEGWFDRIEDVPQTAVTMTVKQILASREIIVVVPDDRKAAAVQATLEAEISPAVPASILRTHDNVTLLLDEAAASRLASAARARWAAQG